MKHRLTVLTAASVDLHDLMHRLLVQVLQAPVTFFETLLRWQQLAAQRRALAAMSDHLLKDIGISRADADREVRRPVWDDPLQQAQWQDRARQ